MTTIRFENPEFSLLEENQYYEQNKKMIAEILRRFESGEDVALIKGENYAFGHREDYYDLLGVWSDERGWEVIPVPVFGRAFGLPENESIRAHLEELCSSYMERDDWSESSNEWALEHEEFSYPLDEEFRAELEAGWLTAAPERNRSETSGGVVVSDGVNEVLYPPTGGFELWWEVSGERRRSSLSRSDPALYCKLGGRSY